MDKENTHLKKKEYLDILGKKISENEELLRDIETLNEKCYILAEKVNYQTDRNRNFKNELEYKKSLCKQIEKTYKSVVSNNPDTIKNVEEMKNEFIKKKLEEILLQNIPEINFLKIVNEEEMDFEQNEFSDLIFDHVTIIHTEYEKEKDSVNKKEEKRSFRISKMTDFHDIKIVACNYFDLENAEDYVLTDDAEALIYNEKYKLNEFFNNYSVLNNSLRLVSLSYLKKRFKLIGLQEYRMKITNKLNLKELKKDENVRQNLNSDNLGFRVKEFLSEYPGLKPFLLEEKIKDASSDKFEESIGSPKNIETSFWNIFCLIFFFILNLISLYSPRNINDNNLKLKYIKEIFKNDGINDYKSLYSYLITTLGFNFLDVTEKDISNYDHNHTLYNEFIEKNLNVLGNDQKWFVVKNETDQNTGKPIFNMDLNITREYLEDYKKGYNNYLLGSSLHFIVNRVKVTECPSDPNVIQFIFEKDICYEVYYDSKTKETKLNTENMNLYKDLFVFKEANEAGINLDISGRSGYFDGSGYHFDIKGNFTFFDYMQLMSNLIPIQAEFNQNTNTTFIATEDDILSFPLVNQNVREIMILFSLYFPSDGNWMNCLIGFDFLPTGILIPGYTKFNLFKSSIYPSKVLFVLSVVRLIIVFIFLAFTVVEIFEKRLQNINMTEAITSPKNFLNLAVLIIYCYIFVLTIVYCNKKDEDFYSIDGQVYKDSHAISHSYNLVFKLESLLIILVMMKIIILLKINSKINLFFTINEFSIKIFIKYLFFFLSILIGFACVAQILWGSYIETFRTFGGSFVQILLMTTGYFDIYGMLYYNSVLCVIFLILFFIFVLFFLFTVFISIFAESFRKTVINMGYPEDQIKKEWSMKDYLIWIFYCVGARKINSEQIS